MACDSHSIGMMISCPLLIHRSIPNKREVCFIFDTAHESYLENKRRTAYAVPLLIVEASIRKSCIDASPFLAAEHVNPIAVQVIEVISPVAEAVNRHAEISPERTDAAFPFPSRSLHLPLQEKPDPTGLLSYSHPPCATGLHEKMHPLLLDLAIK